MTVHGKKQDGSSENNRRDRKMVEVVTLPNRSGACRVDRIYRPVRELNSIAASFPDRRCADSLCPVVFDGGKGDRKRSLKALLIAAVGSVRPCAGGRLLPVSIAGWSEIDPALSAKSEVCFRDTVLTVNWLDESVSTIEDLIDRAKRNAGRNLPHRPA